MASPLDSLEYFGPKFFCSVEDSNQTNQNSPQYLEDIKNRVIDQLRTMPFAPSVGMHEVPMMSVGEAIRVSDEEDGSEDEDDVDVQISCESQVLLASWCRSSEADDPFLSSQID